jgi:hypothetical protein
MKWGWHWAINFKTTKVCRIGVWFGSTQNKPKFYIPFINQLWVKL